MGALSTLLLLGFGIHQGPSEASEPGADPVRYHVGPLPEPDLSLITDQNRPALNLAAELVDAHKDAFTGTFVDPRGRVHVVAATDRGQGLAADVFKGRSDAAIDRGNLTIDDATRLGANLYESLPDIGIKMWTWSAAADNSSLQVGLTSPLTDYELGELRSFANANSITVDAYADENAERPTKDSRQGDNSPFAGGFRYATGDATSNPRIKWVCSGGFGYSRNGTDYMLTAGHCLDRDTSFKYTFNTNDDATKSIKNWIGHRSYSSWTDGVGSVVLADSSYHGDLALFNVDVAGKAAGTQIWWGTKDTTNKIPVTARRSPTVGDPVCINGITSGSDCGTAVDATNVAVLYNTGEYVVNGDRAVSTSSADCSQEGDSGGSVVYNHSGAETQATAEGIVSGSGGGSSGCYQYFTGVEEAIQAWGGNIKFN